MKREAEDLLLSSSSDKNGRDALRFVLALVNNRKDMKHIKKGELAKEKKLLVKWLQLYKKVVIALYTLILKSIIVHLEDYYIEM